jgi:uncharacterized protein with ParB-like and HNH nuclease domain
MSDEKLETTIINVGQLLLYEKLVIPQYQRPYKWTTQNVLQLVEDIYNHKNKSAYRLGTIVLHDDGKNLNIVDGQQRTITLILLAKAIIQHRSEIVKNPETTRLMHTIKEKLINPDFNNDLSIFNIRENYFEIERRIASFDEHVISFIFNKCEFIQFILKDISEAFQFFDSQNTRGKDLEPHDLLKAYHLREFSINDESAKSKVVDSWEAIDTKQLSKLFAEFLYRIKGWAKGNSSRYFSKKDTTLFKGINIEKIENYPYTDMIRIAHFFVDRYNDNYERKIDGNKSKFPFQLDQTIINGRRFFEMIIHYKNVYDNYKRDSTDKTKLNDIAIRIMVALDTYEGRNRTGDEYVRMLFDCALIYYIDKFGYQEISKAIEKIFISAYSVRLNYQNVQMASVDNYVVQEFNIFRKIKDANKPEELLSHYLKSVDSNKSSKTKELELIFKDLKYYGK